MMLRFAQLSDRETVNALALQVHDLHVGWQPQYYEHTDILYDEARFREAVDSRSLYVAVSDGDIVGYVLIGVMELNHPGLVCSKTLRLEELCVVREYRHRGIGKQIMEAVKALAKDLGCTDIRLTCAPQNAAAIGLYESFGMEIKAIQYRIEV